MFSGNAKGGSGGGGGGGGACTIADGADGCEGTTTDAAVTGDNGGTVSAKLRGINKILADVWNSALHLVKVAVQASTSGGATPYHLVLANSNNAQTVKASAGQVYGIHPTNISALPFYVKLYDKASAPDPAADTPVAVYGVQVDVPRDVVIPVGLTFALGIAVLVVTGVGNSDNTSVAAGAGVLALDYK